MSRVIDADYSQGFLLPPNLEDWIEPEHPARFIRAFVDSIDLASAGISWGSSSLRGRPSYAASLLLKVHLYARFMGIKSYRRMEAACRDSVGMLWLTGREVPDHNTLWGFFLANRAGLRSVFKHSVVVAVKADLIGLALHALDGTKVQAAVANESGLHRERLLKERELIDQAIDEVETRLEQSGQEGRSQALALPERLRHAQTLRDTIQEAIGQLDSAQQSHLHPSDPDARVMKCRDKGRNTFCYNDQVVVDEDSRLIVAEQATTAVNDCGHLVDMITQAHELLGGQVQTTVADAGYMSTAQLALAEQHEESALVNLPERFKRTAKKPFAGANFRYDEATDTVICPLGQRLEYTHTRFHSNRKQYLRCFRCRCNDCPSRSDCTGDRKGRKIELAEDYAALQHQQDRHEIPEERAKLAKRSYIVEPVFGWIKQQLGFRRHTVFGLDSVRAEWSLIAATYNLHRLYKLWRKGWSFPDASPEPRSQPQTPGRSQNSHQGSSYEQRITHQRFALPGFCRYAYEL